LYRSRPRRELSVYAVDDESADMAATIRAGKLEEKQGGAVA
jgi:hypothetical protein